MERVLQLVREERARQRQKYPDDRYMDPESCLPVLIEEVGEVARGMLEEDSENMKDELVQVAALAVAWLEDIKIQEDNIKHGAAMWDARQKEQFSA